MRRPKRSSATAAINLDLIMLKYVLLFLISTIVSGLLGFGNTDGEDTILAKVMFFGFLVLFAISLNIWIRRRSYVNQDRRERMFR